MENIFEIESSFAKNSEDLKTLAAALLKKDEEFKQVLGQIDAYDSIGRKKAEDAYGLEIGQFAKAFNTIESQVKTQQETARGLLQSGKWKAAGDPFAPKPGEIRPPDYKPPSQKDILRSVVSIGYGIPKENIDIDSGIDPSLRFSATALEPHLRTDFYKQQLGEENIKAVPMDGGEAVFVKTTDPKDPSKEKWVLSDELGVTVADWQELGIRGVKEGIGAGGAALGAAGGFVSGWIPGAMLGGGSGYYATMTGMDASLQNTIFDGKSPESLKDISDRRFKEAQYEALFEGIGFVPMSFLAKRVGGEKVVTRGNKEISQAFDRMVDMGRIDKKQRARLQQLIDADEKTMSMIANKAFRSPTSTLADDYGALQTAVKELQDGVAKNGPEMGRRLYGETIKAVDSSMRKLETLASKYDPALATMLAKDRKRQAESMGVSFEGWRNKIDNRFTEMLSKQRDLAIAAKNESYDEFYKKADQSGALLERIELATFMRNQYAKEPALRNTAIEGIIKELEVDPDPEIAKLLEQKKSVEERIDKAVDTDERGKLMRQSENLDAQVQQLATIKQPLSLKQVRDYYLRVSEAAPEGFAVKPPGAAAQAMKVSEEVSNMFQQIVKASGLEADWNVATNQYKRRLDSESSLFKDVLALDDSGMPILTPTQVTQKVLSDPDYVRQAYESLYQSKPKTAKNFIHMAQRAYLDKIAVRHGGSVKAMDFDSDMVQSLWGYNRKGEPNTFFGDRMVQKLELLNQKLEKLGASTQGMSMNDLDQLSDVLTKDGIEEMTDEIAMKALYVQKQETIKNNKLLDLATSAAKNGEFEGIDPGFLPKVIIGSGNTTRVRQLLDLMPDNEKEVLKSDMLYELFDRYSVKDRKGVTPYLPWDYDGLMRDLSQNKNLRQNFEMVVGKDEMNLLMDVSRVAKKMDIDPKSGSLISLRANASEKGRSVWVAGALSDAAKKAALTTLYKTGHLTPFMKYLSKSVDSPTYMKRMRDFNVAMHAAVMFPRLMGESLRNDPEMMEYMGSKVPPKEDE